MEVLQSVVNIPKDFADIVTRAQRAEEKVASLQKQLSKSNLKQETLKSEEQAKDLKTQLEEKEKVVNHGSRFHQTDVMLQYGLACFPFGRRGWSWNLSATAFCDSTRSSRSSWLRRRQSWMRTFKKLMYGPCVTPPSVLP